MYQSRAVSVVFNAALPITTSEAKAQLRVTHSSEDSLIALYLGAAVRKVENYCQLPLMPATITEIFDVFPDGGVIDLSWGKVSAIASISYNTAEAPGTFATIDAANYILESGYNRARIRTLDGFEFEDGPFQIKVIYTAGYADADAVPDDLKIAAMLILSDFYENRTDNARTMPTHAQSILAPYATMRV